MKTKYKTPSKPPKDALDFLNAKKLTPSFDHRDVYREEHGYAFVVAKLMQLDLLQTVHNALGESLERGTTFSQFKKDLIPTLQRQGWWGEQELIDPLTGEKRLVQTGSPRRLKIIYNVNMRTARAAGQWQRIERTKKSHPYLVYELGPSREHRDEHVGWAGILLQAEDPFWQTHFPPNGWGCKCRVRQVSRREYERLHSSRKYLTKAPVINRKEWRNRRTDEVLQVPEGIDPSFDINAGIARQAHIQTLIKTKLNSVNPAIAQAAAKELVHSPAFTLFLREPVNEYPVASLDNDLKRRLSAKQNAVLLSADTLAKQRRNHPELTDAEYRLLPDIINKGAVIAQDNQRVVFFAHEQRLYKAVVKATRAGDELYVVSFHRADSRDYDREANRGIVIRSENK